MERSRTLLLLSIFYALVFVFSAIDPLSDSLWMIAIFPAAFAMGMIWWTSYYVMFSRTAYIMMFIWLILHTFGAKYSFSHIPLAWLQTPTGNGQYSYGYLLHFALGLYAYPVAEYLLRHHKCKARFAMSYAFFAMIALAAGCEMTKWGYTQISGDLSLLAIQHNNAWISQKNILSGALGAVFALSWLRLQHKIR